MNLLEAFLLGVLATMSITAGVFFLRFWRDTRDSFFLAFAVSFLIEGLNRTTLLAMDNPSEGAPWTYIVRLVAVLLILGAIIKKNYGKNG
jgi:uncharacterized membrane protein HdeD (DUF308 family)